MTKTKTIIDYNIDQLKGLTGTVNNLVNTNGALLNIIGQPVSGKAELRLNNISLDLKSINERLIRYIDLLEACNQEMKEAINV